MKKILEVERLKKYFPIKRGFLQRKVGETKAVDGISFSIAEGEIVGLVGESGSGKSTAGRASIRLIEPTEGIIRFMGEDLTALSSKQLRSIRPNVQMIFQDPLASLNPRKTILENVGEALLYHKRVATREKQIEEVSHILSQVGIPQSALQLYPHQFSGGQQQRISIGRAIALKPKLIICDEAVSALDLSVRAQILNLLLDLKHSLKLSYLFISHDLSVIRHLCDQTLVMYQGKIIERGQTETVFANPKHPYTQMLIASAPIAHPRDKRKELPLKIERPVTFSTGCPFFSRCAKAKAVCEHTPPPEKGKGTHTYHCIYD